MTPPNPLAHIAITWYVITYNVILMSDPTLLVLSSLAEGDKHGYAMMEDIERFAGVRLGPGTLYGAITRLEERGWIGPVKSRDERCLCARRSSCWARVCSSLDRATWRIRYLLR